MYEWPPVGEVLDVRALNIEVTATASGGSTLYVDAQSQWIVTRPLRERVPAGVHEIVVSEANLGGATKTLRTVTAPAKLRSLAALLDSYWLVQPGAISCPIYRTTRTVILTFRSAGGAELARASATTGNDESWPPSIAGWACYPIDFTIDGRAQPALAGNLIAPLERILHVRFRR
jgi:hypothetical protein